MNCPVKKTTEAARILGVPVYNLLNWVRYGVIATPMKDSSGHYVWSEEDLALGRQVWQARQKRQDPRVQQRVVGAVAV